MTDDAPDGAKFAYMHGDHVAFYLTELPVSGTVIDRKIFITVDGSVGKIPHLCGTCGEQIPGASTEHVREL